jgi:hypothetical protein
MHPYRLYLLNREDRIADALEGLFADDRAALEKAEVSGKNFYAVEVWSGGRLVGRLGHEFMLG